jgi:hypothetical protein
MAIDWNYWLKCRTLTEIEVVLLTLGLDPESYQTGSLAGEHYLVNDADLKQKQKDYIRRMGVIEQYRTKSYDFMANDGEWGDCFWANNQKVYVNRFLLWLKNDDRGWDLPKELQAYIEKLNMPNQEHGVQELGDNDSSKSWKSKAKEVGEKYLDDYGLAGSGTDKTLGDICKFVAKELNELGYKNFKGKPLIPETVRSECLGGVWYQEMVSKGKILPK